MSEQLRAFIDTMLGSPDVPPERAVARYAELLSDLRRLVGLAPELETVRELAGRVESAWAVRLAMRLRTVPLDPMGEDAVLPVTWREAWNWARMRSHLDAIDAREELVALAAKRSSLELALVRHYRELVANAAWLATKRNATPWVLSALQGYATAIGRIGKGTGPNAFRYRRDARDAMLSAAKAIPCWIMSHARISESMPPDIGAFDLVIVDEASQSDLWALPVILRGKKILVVGDHKQVSPDAGFIAAARITNLRTRYLAEQPFGAEMTPEKSLYDLASRVFAATQVMLREHFRCVPAIISDSNRVFYKGAIQPVRIPRLSERIDPPLVDVYVPDGVRNPHDCNDLEAQAMAEEVAKILADGRLAGRTIGVVSLLGMEQAKHIDTIVRSTNERYRARARPL